MTLKSVTRLVVCALETVCCCVEKSEQFIGNLFVLYLASVCVSLCVLAAVAAGVIASIVDRTMSNSGVLLRCFHDRATGGYDSPTEVPHSYL